MNDAEYLQTQMQVLLLAGLLLQLDLPAFLHRIEAAEALGPVLDPTLYRRAADNLAALRETALILNSARQELLKRCKNE